MGLKKVLITGVTGFLGKALVSSLQHREDISLFGHSRDASNARKLFKDVPIRVLDDIEIAGLDELEIDAIVHLAGIAHDLSNKYLAEDYFTVNDKGTRALYDKFLKSRAKSFIFVSSIKAAVDAASAPVTEDVDPTPISPYGQSKLRAEQYIQQHRGFEKEYYILRPCMVHGPGNKGNLNLLYKYAKTGLPFPLGAFQNQRSFLSVDNFSFIIDKLITQKVPSGIYHLSDDGSMSTPDLFKLTARTAGKLSPVLSIPQSLVSAAFMLLRKKRMLQKLTEDMLVSNARIKRHLGPLPVTIEQGLVKTIQSFNDRP